MSIFHVAVLSDLGHLLVLFTDAVLGNRPLHLASKPVSLSMNLSKTKVMLNESATTSTVAVDGNTTEKVDR